MSSALIEDRALCPDYRAGNQPENAFKQAIDAGGCQKKDRALDNDSDPHSELPHDRFESSRFLFARRPDIAERSSRQAGDSLSLVQTRLADFGNTGQ